MWKKKFIIFNRINLTLSLFTFSFYFQSYCFIEEVPFLFSFSIIFNVPHLCKKKYIWLLFWFFILYPMLTMDCRKISEKKCVKKKVNPTFANMSSVHFHPLFLLSLSPGRPLFSSLLDDSLIFELPSLKAISLKCSMQALCLYIFVSPSPFLPWETPWCHCRFLK